MYSGFTSLSVACGPLIINDKNRHLSNREVLCTVFVVCASIYVSVSVYVCVYVYMYVSGEGAGVH